MTWMIVRLILSLAFVGAVLWFAARLAKKRGLGQTNGLIEVVARQRMGRSSTVNVVRIADVVLVVGATEEQVTLLAEVDAGAVDAALAERHTPERRAPARRQVAAAASDDDVDERTPAPVGVAAARTTMPSMGTGALAGSVFDRRGWGAFVHELREKTVRRP